MGRENKALGGYGERVALDFLTEKGYRILETNLRTPFGEIDAVAKVRDHIVFVEIKTRTTCSLGPPYLAVTKVKQMHIVKNALHYLRKQGLSHSNWRIDVVSVKIDFDRNIEHIELIENAVEDNNY